MDFVIKNYLHLKHIKTNRIKENNRNIQKENICITDFFSAFGKIGKVLLEKLRDFLG